MLTSYDGFTAAHLLNGVAAWCTASSLLAVSSDANQQVCSAGETSLDGVCLTRGRLFCSFNAGRTNTFIH